MAVLVAVVSDTHINSTVGLALPDFEREDGQVVYSSPAQMWLWRCWQDYWAEVKKRKKRGDQLYIIVNGDAVDGPGHHGTPQSVSYSLMDEVRHAIEIYRPIREMADHMFIVRGTESHVGIAGSQEEYLGALLKCEKDKESFTFLRLVMEVEGVRFHFTHHGRVGRTLTTRNNPAAKFAAEHYFQALKLGRTPADVVVMSHHHLYADSGTALPTRVFQTPAWQLSTHYVYRFAPDENSISDIGGLLFRCEDGKYDMEWIGRGKYVPEETKVWQPSQALTKTSSSKKSGRRTPTKSLNQTTPTFILEEN